MKGKRDKVKEKGTGIKRAEGGVQRYRDRDTNTKCVHERWGEGGLVVRHSQSRVQ